MNFTLYDGDCLERMREIADGSVDMVMADLPYGTTACKWDAVIPFEPLWAAYRRVCKANAAIVLTASQPFTSALVMSNPSAFRYEVIWVKHQATNPMSAKHGILKVHESILLFGKSPTYNPQMEFGKVYRAYKSRMGKKVGEAYGAVMESMHKGNPDGALYPVSFLHFPGNSGSGSVDGAVHPTQKPVALMEYLVRTYTNAGETVLDNTMGSGTTGVACMNTGRRFIGIERDPEYFALARGRIEAAQPKYCGI
jgi:site-specific DNA-methyltransferase (adenine-specific)